MTDRRPFCIPLATDDRAIAGVVGFVLVLAAAITYYSYVAQNEVPRVGAQNERAWDADVGAALTRLAHGAGERAGTGEAVREIVPPAPDEPTQTIPFLSPLRSARAAGSLSYSEACGGASVLHGLGAVVVEDLKDGAHGCITFRGDTIYAEPFAYRIELGGVLRTEGDRAAVLAGPPLTIDGDRIALTLVDLRGSSQTLGVDGADAPVGLAPRPGSLEVGTSANADLASWTLTTNYPEAWRDWYQERFDAAGVPATIGSTCANPTASGPLRGPCQVDVTTVGVTSLSVSYGRYDVSLG